MGRSCTLFSVVGISVVIYAVILSWRRGITTTDNLLPEYDYVIVGSGSAGSVLASRLSEDPDVTVLLLEAGGDESGDWVPSIPLFYIDLWRSAINWGFLTVPQEHSHYGFDEKRSYWPAGKALGGSTSINGMIYTRGSRHDFDTWRDGGAQGWGYTDILPYFLKSEDVQIDRYKTSGYHNEGGYLHVSENNATTLSDVFIQAGQELGYDEIDFNGREMVGFTRVPTTTHKGSRDSVARAFLRPAMDRPNLHISINSRATKILMNGKRATGVEFVKGNQKFQISVTREVIVSAGAVMSPQLLMLSGIGPKKHLDDVGIPVVADLPVGDNLHDHMFFSLISRTNSSALFSWNMLYNPLTWIRYLLFGTGWLGNTGILTTIGFLQMDGELSKTRPGQPDLEVYIGPATLGNWNKKELDENTQNIQRESSLNILLTPAHPFSRGTVRLRSADPLDTPLIDPRYLEHPDDMKVFLKGIQVCQQLGKTKAMQNLGVNLDDPNFKVPECITKVGSSDSDEYWECALRTLAMTAFHPVGTCKMGAAGDTSAVVDPQLRVKGIQGLRVVDASIMPRINSANTNAATIMIAEKASDMIRGIDSVKHLGSLKNAREAGGRWRYEP